jgi:hypothetical protein
MITFSSAIVAQAALETSALRSTNLLAGTVGAIIPDENNGRLLRYSSDYAKAIKKSAWKRVILKILTVAVPVHIAVTLLADVGVRVIQYLKENSHIKFCLKYDAECFKGEKNFSASQIIFYGANGYDLVLTTLLYVPIFISIFSGRGAVFGLGLTMLLVNVVKQPYTVLNVLLKGWGESDFEIPVVVVDVLIAAEILFNKSMDYTIKRHISIEILAKVLFYSVYVLFFLLNIVAPAW